MFIYWQFAAKTYTMTISTQDVLKLSICDSELRQFRLCFWVCVVVVVLCVHHDSGSSWRSGSAHFLVQSPRRFGPRRPSPPPLPLFVSPGVVVMRVCVCVCSVHARVCVCLHRFRSLSLRETDRPVGAQERWWAMSCPLYVVGIVY